MEKYELIKEVLKSSQKTWLITGVAGFIGSNLLDFLLLHNQKVIGLDNFSLGYKKNLDEVRSKHEKNKWKNFKFLEGNILNFETCQKVCKNVDYVLHQAALGSVPRSIEDPLKSHDSNVNGFLNILLASRDADIKGFVYAASSSTYGDHPGLPKVEDIIGKPLSPYAVTKYINELYAEVFSTCYDFHTVGLRYFNVFGPRQDPTGAYAAVIPLWISSLISRSALYINGDGETTRDFCYVENVVQANILAATLNDISIDNKDFKKLASHEVFNIACGDSTSLNNLFKCLVNTLSKMNVNVHDAKPVYQDYRDGDVRYSLADISKAKNLLGYYPRYSVEEGIEKSMSWYINNSN